jgi:hypothetical protein
MAGVLVDRMLAMTVTEIPRRLEPVTQDTFLSGTPSSWDTPGESISEAPRSRPSSSTEAER